MADDNRKAADEAHIRALIDDWLKAVRAKDVDGATACYAKGVLTFSLAPPLRTTGVDKKEVEAWFASFQSPIGYEIRDLDVTVGGDVAFCHSLNHIVGTKVNGEQSDVWVRSTLCLRYIEGRWLVVHEHQSTPFYMDGSGRAALDLNP